MCRLRYIKIYIRAEVYKIIYTIYKIVIYKCSTRSSQSTFPSRTLYSSHRTFHITDGKHRLRNDPSRVTWLYGSISFLSYSPSLVPVPVLHSVSTGSDFVVAVEIRRLEQGSMPYSDSDFDLGWLEQLHEPLISL